MKIIFLASLIFFLQISIAAVDLLNLYDFNIVVQEDWFEEAESIKTKDFNPNQAVDVATSFGFGDFVTGFQTIRDTIWRVVNVGATLKLFGVHEGIANLIGFGMFFLWGLGIAQFISNRSTTGMA